MISLVYRVFLLGALRNRLLGIFLMVVLLYGILITFDETTRSVASQVTTAKRLGFYGVMTLGVGVLIITGGIDLSIGSVVALGAIVFGLLLTYRVPPWQAAVVVMALSAVIGLAHGLLVTQLKLQPFLVTLCGLFIYRGLARFVAPRAGLASEAPQAFQEEVRFIQKWLVGDPFGIPQQFILLMILAVFLALFLHGTSYGRYLFAIGANEQAARYAGISTDRYKILAYLISSMLAGLASILEILDVEAVQASTTGQLYELYAITGAVLGGCSLSGGVGSIPGMVLGAAVLPLLRKVCSSLDISPELEYAVIGMALLLGTIADQIVQRRSKGRSG